MASTKHYNNIKIARGSRDSWIENAKVGYGELFFDKNTNGLYITVPDEAAPNKMSVRRFGGFESMIIKGTITSANFNEIKVKAEPGDAYIVTGAINVVQPEITFDNQGNVIRKETSTRTYDNYFKNGQVIIFTDEDVSAVPNAYQFNEVEIAANTEGSKGIITLAGTAEAVDLEYDGSLTEVATNVTDVQTAIDLLFNDKNEFIGSFADVTLTSTDDLSNGDNYKPATGDDKIWAIIAKKLQLKMGQSIVYSGKSKAVTVADGDITIKTNTMIYNNAGTIHTVPLGANDARDALMAFTGNTKTDETTASFTTTNANGEQVTINEADIETVQHALDFLHQNKADLNANGKIPLSQIPSTMIGALQYVGTVVIEDGTTTLTKAQLAALMAKAKDGGDSWEKDTDTQTDSQKAKAYNELDSGDYVIISIPNPTSQGVENPLTRQIIITENPTEGAESTPATIFTISNGDHVIVNAVTGDDITFDHIDSSAAVDAVNQILGSVEIIDTERTVGTGFEPNAAATTASIKETDVITDVQAHSIKTEIRNTVLEPTEIGAHGIPQASGVGKSILPSELFINETTNNSSYKTGDNLTHNTELKGKTAAGDEVVVEFPDKSGKLSVTIGGNGDENVLPKYDANGNLIMSEVSQTKDGVSNTGTLHLGNNFDINYDELSKLIQYLRGEIKITRIFDHDSANIHSETWEARNHDEAIIVLLDEDSAIDGGEWN